MIPPIFTILNASAAVKAIFGTNPLRVFPWGEAPQNVQKPYATYITVSGIPENMLGETPDMDFMNTQIDVWDDDVSGCNTAAKAIRDALEPSSYLTSFDTPNPDEETGLFRTRMDFDFHKDR